MWSLIKGNPLWAGLIGVAIVVFILAGFRSCDKRESQEEANLVNQGIIVERDAAKTEVINHVEQAQDAVANPTSNDLNVVCSKYDRNCQNSQ